MASRNGRRHDPPGHRLVRFRVTRQVGRTVRKPCGVLRHGCLERRKGFSRDRVTVGQQFNRTGHLRETQVTAAGTHYTVLARRFRPQAFDDVVGQEHVARALRNAIRAGRVAHAYMFTGARGVGKTSTPSSGMLIVTGQYRSEKSCAVEMCFAGPAPSEFLVRPVA